MSLITSFLHRNRSVLIALLIITPIGFYSKFYSGPLRYWVNDSLCDVFYVIFWCLVLALFFNRLKPMHIAGIVLFATCILEFLQLWHPPFLELLRSNFIGVTILGNVFTWSDFPYYFLGSLIGYFWVSKLSVKNNM
ncbi:MAG: DUF2809 domain-containing protein [Candidatus Marinimicrobia bacterium]|nr:DUF2809 domain-containing protein [Candidatus Neomarinimicrobiota bacterium]